VSGLTEGQRRTNGQIGKIKYLYHTDSQDVRQASRRIYRRTNINKERQTEIGRQNDRKTDRERQKDIETERQKTVRETLRHNDKN
jgi:hypothetical protein